LILKKIIKAILRVFFKAIHIDIFFRFCQRSSRLVAKLVFFRDWDLMAYGRPQFFNHQLNLYLWLKDPKQWAFTARGVYPRERMFFGCKVLDLCCGDGSYSYLFFSDIAGRIDAVDNDLTALDFARKNYRLKNLVFYHLDIIKAPLPASDYDFIIWNAAISYFDEKETHAILSKIITVGSDNFRLYGVTPITVGYVDHKKEFSSPEELEQLLSKYFNNVDIKVIDELSVKNMYFCASAPCQQFSERNL
jgi:SAM-dependent methyltransferase